MTVLELFNEFRARFETGHLLLGADESIDCVIARNSIPNGQGVYVISDSQVGTGELLYIGKSGTVRADGSFGRQTIPQRLRMKQDGMSRRAYFQQQMAAEHISSLRFDWFITCGQDVKVWPFLAEAQLAAAYLDQFHRLPRWNKSI